VSKEKETAVSTFEKKIQEQTADTAFKLVWGWVEKLANKAWEKNKVRQAMKSYSENYRERHGAIHVLGMSRPIPLHEIYTAVRVVTRDFLGAFVHHDQMEREFRASGRQHSSFDKDKVEDGIDVANREQFLNLLGAPGAGKSTFLRRLGQEAMLARTPREQIDTRDTKLDSHYEHALLPVFLELRGLRTKSIDLIARITEEFAICEFPESQAFVEASLANGKMLILLDGLDEVPNEKLNDVIDHIRGFVDEHSKAGNRFVTSCRTAHYKDAFPRFTDMVVADFSDEQIEKFANNWFTGLHNKQDETAKKFVELLKEPTNAAVLELARTPLLLTFLCITYNYGGVLPPTRATLYRRALDLLLREWAASKRVHDEPVYRELNADLELDMLAELAEELFREDRLFFKRERVTSHILTFMREQLNAPKSLDAGRILEAIEVQQGLIVRRALDTYSFSHLTIQEYLTAKSVWEKGQLAWTQVINSHLSEARWSVVFQLMAGMGNADYLLAAMIRRSREGFEQWLNSDTTALAILEWIEENTKPDPTISAELAATSRLLLLATTLALYLAHRFPSADNSEIFLSLLNTVTLAQQLAREIDVPLSRDIYTLQAMLLRNESVNQHVKEFDRNRSRAVLSLLVETCFQYKLVGESNKGLTALVRRLAQHPINASDIERVYGDIGLACDRVPEMTSFISYMHSLFQIILCKRAAYRLSAETWGMMCNSVLRLLSTSNESDARTS
jgi:hypothetical protein